MLLPWFMHVSFDDDDDFFGKCETEQESLSPPLKTDVAGKISLSTGALGKDCCSAFLLFSRSLAFVSTYSIQLRRNVYSPSKMLSQFNAVPYFENWE
jgi:hypothetical protein